jgi:hypothetical protein
MRPISDLHAHCPIFPTLVCMALLAVMPLIAAETPGFVVTATSDTVNSGDSHPTALA